MHSTRNGMFSTSDILSCQIKTQVTVDNNNKYEIYIAHIQ